MSRETSSPILVVGAGMTGLMAATRLQQAGLPVLVLDKGRGVGGRMATRRFDGGRFDHGAQVFSVRDERLGNHLHDWRAAGVISAWGPGLITAPGSASMGDPVPYIGTDGMTTLPKFLAGQIDVHLRTRVVEIAREGDGWTVLAHTGARYRGRALLLTPPVPQMLALVAASQLVLPGDVQEQLERIEYDPCLALMALFAGPSRLPEPGGLRFSAGPISWMADNHRKGISPGGYAVTIHAAAAYSRRNWETDESQVAQELRAAAAEWLHPELLAWQLHRWRYSQPTATYGQPAVCLPDEPYLALAGDAFGGPHVEGAAISGFVAAEALAALLA